jgi:uncharacterized protein
MIIEGSLRLDQGKEIGRLIAEASRRDGFDEARVRAYRIVRRAVAARGKGPPTVYLRLELRLGDGEGAAVEELASTAPVGRREAPRAGIGPGRAGRPVIVGFGPAGTFAALRLLESGVAPIILEQGRAVDARAQDVRALRTHGQLDPYSNVAFGEGGAGTFSDGKLRTRKRHADIDAVLATFVAYGARPSLLYESHPHVGTDVLIKIARRLREDLVSRGVELRFEARVTELLADEARRSALGEGRPDRAISGLRLASGEELATSGVLLGPGNSARPLFEALERAGVRMEARASAVGFRVEHERAWVDRRRYGPSGLAAGLSGAEYALRAKSGERGVYSFCMCPGGYVVPSHVEDGTVRVNGMSNSRRGATYSNSAIVVTVTPDDYRAFQGDAEAQDAVASTASVRGALVGLRFQRAFEARAGAWGVDPGVAPAQRVSDFIAARESQDLCPSSYRPGLVSAPLHRFYPEALTRALVDGLRRFERGLPGFAGREALLIAPETGTSSPLVITRGDDGQSVSHHGLFPMGEGAGYAGGIMSSALDGVAAAERWLALNS